MADPPESAADDEKGRLPPEQRGESAAGLLDQGNDRDRLAMLGQASQGLQPAGLAADRPEPSAAGYSYAPPAHQEELGPELGTTQRSRDRAGSGGLAPGFYVSESEESAHSDGQEEDSSYHSSDGSETKRKRRPKRRRSELDEREGSEDEDDGGSPRRERAGSLRDSSYERDSDRQPGYQNPYVCSVCNATFTRRHDLVRHQRRHEGQKPYRCGDCGEGFYRSDALQRHKSSDRGKRQCKQRVGRATRQQERAALEQIPTPPSTSNPLWRGAPRPVEPISMSFGPVDNRPLHVPSRMAARSVGESSNSAGIPMTRPPSTMASTDAGQSSSSTPTTIGPLPSEATRSSSFTLGRLAPSVSSSTIATETASTTGPPRATPYAYWEGDIYIAPDDPVWQHGYEYGLRQAKARFARQEAKRNSWRASSPIAVQTPGGTTTYIGGGSPHNTESARRSGNVSSPSSTGGPPASPVQTASTPGPLYRRASSSTSLSGAPPQTIRPAHGRPSGPPAMQTADPMLAAARPPKQAQHPMASMRRGTVQQIYPRGPPPDMTQRFQPHINPQGQSYGYPPPPSAPLQQQQQQPLGVMPNHQLIPMAPAVPAQGQGYYAPQQQQPYYDPVVATPPGPNPVYPPPPPNFADQQQQQQQSYQPQLPPPPGPPFQPYGGYPNQSYPEPQPPQQQPPMLTPPISYQQYQHIGPAYDQGYPSQPRPTPQAAGYDVSAVMSQRGTTIGAPFIRHVPGRPRSGDYQGQGGGSGGYGGY